jgi:hypothetical protein
VFDHFSFQKSKPLLPLPPCSLCEHDGRFNMLHPLLHHMQANQQGQGVVAVSPRYALRQVDWQSRWLLAAG